MRSYLTLLRDNPNYFRLWCAQAISLIGDWFNTIVLSALVARYSEGSGWAISALLLSRFLPPLIVSPLAGILLDRFDRKKMLIMSDLLRAVVVIGFLLVRSADTLWLIFVLTVLQFSLSAIFEPGRSALLPSVVRREDLVRANILGSITWSVMLAIGGALGGVVAAVLGTEVALLIAPVTYLLSAAFITRIRMTPPKDVPGVEIARPTGISLRDYVEGLRYARRNPSTAAILLIKFGGNFGNMDAILIVYATALFVLGEDGSGTLGIFWSVFGVGAIIGPLILNYFNDGSVRVMRRLILAGYALITIGWLAIGAAPTLLIAAFAICVKAMGGSVYWTYSSAILQKTVPDQFLGRIFSLDMAGFQLATVTSVILTGWALETFGEGQIRSIVYITAIASLIPLFAWGIALPYLERLDARQTPVAQPTTSGL